MILLLKYILLKIPLEAALLSYIQIIFPGRGLLCLKAVLTTQSTSSALQGHLPREGIPSRLLCLELFQGTWEHIAPQQQHLWEMVPNDRRT